VLKKEKMKMENIKLCYCGNCFRAVAEDEPVACGVNGSGVCCMSCFLSMTEDNHE